MRNWARVTSEFLQRYGLDASDPDIDGDKFFLLLEAVWLDLAQTNLGVGKHSFFEIEDHYRAFLYGAATGGGKAGGAYPDFPDDPNEMSKEDHLRIQMQAEVRDMVRRQKLADELYEYRAWKEAELARREANKTEG